MVALWSLLGGALWVCSGRGSEQRVVSDRQPPTRSNQLHAGTGRSAARGRRQSPTGRAGPITAAAHSIEAVCRRYDSRAAGEVGLRQMSATILSPRLPVPSPHCSSQSLDQLCVFARETSLAGRRRHRTPGHQNQRRPVLPKSESLWDQRFASTTLIQSLAGEAGRGRGVPRPLAPQVPVSTSSRHLCRRPS